MHENETSLPSINSRQECMAKEHLNRLCHLKFTGELLIALLGCSTWGTESFLKKIYNIVLPMVGE